MSSLDFLAIIFKFKRLSTILNSGFKIVLKISDIQIRFGIENSINNHLRLKNIIHPTKHEFLSFESTNPNLSMKYT